MNILICSSWYFEKASFSWPWMWCSTEKEVTYQKINDNWRVQWHANYVSGKWQFGLQIQISPNLFYCTNVLEDSFLLKSNCLFSSSTDPWFQWQKKNTKNSRPRSGGCTTQKQVDTGKTACGVWWCSPPSDSQNVTFNSAACRTISTEVNY